MKYYLAPLEGITGYIYRNAYEKVFSDIDKYFAPFITPNESDRITTKEFIDILPENNIGINLVPQILTDDANGCINTMKKIQSLGYSEVNINLGCPSPRVVSKGRGSGFLAKTDELDRFLDDIFKHGDMRISIKTRLGMENPEEFYKLLKIYNQYPINELIVHLRTRSDFYKNKPNLEMYRYTLDNSTNPICYNGDIFTIEDNKKIIEEFPQTDRIMLGRGVIANPSLISEIKTGKIVRYKEIKEFHDELLMGYSKAFENDKRVILFKMKEAWRYMNGVFKEDISYTQKIRKSENLNEYKEVVKELFQNLNIN